MKYKKMITMFLHGSIILPNNGAMKHMGLKYFMPISPVIEIAHCAG